MAGSWWRKTHEAGAFMELKDAEAPPQEPYVIVYDNDEYDHAVVLELGTGRLFEGAPRSQDWQVSDPVPQLMKARTHE